MVPAPPTQPTTTVTETSAATVAEAPITTVAEAPTTTTQVLSPQNLLLQFQSLFNQMTNRPNGLVFHTRPAQPISNPQRAASINVATTRPLAELNVNTQPAASLRNQRTLQENTPTEAKKTWKKEISKR